MITIIENALNISRNHFNILCDSFEIGMHLSFLRLIISSDIPPSSTATTNIIMPEELKNVVIVGANSSMSVIQSLHKKLPQTHRIVLIEANEYAYFPPVSTFFDKRYNTQNPLGSFKSGCCTILGKSSYRFPR